MNCNCIKEKSEMLKTRVLEKDANPPTGASVASVNPSNFSLLFRSGKWVLFIPFTVNWDGVKPRTAGVRKGQTTINVLATHCPFCGKEIE